MSRIEPRNILLFGFVALLFIGTGFYQSWNTALAIFNMGLVSAIMALGVNMQWGYAGLFNVGIVGFVAVGGLAAVLVSMPPVPDAWNAGGPRMVLAMLAGASTIAAAILVWKRLPRGLIRTVALLGVLIAGYVIYRALFDPARDAIEDINPALSGYLGGLGLPIVLAWPVGGLFAAGAAWLVGKTALGLRSDYLAIATLGIAEILISIMKNEDWLGRGVKNVTGLPRPVPYEIDLQNSSWFNNLADSLGANVVSFSSVFVKLSYSALFIVVLLGLIWFSQKALHSPWGRMMRAIRDNEVSSAAMGKNITARHLQIFVLGSAVVGLAGAMMTTLDGQLVPSSYNPLRFTFLVWVMVIVGGSGNNWGAVLGGFLIWWLWIQVEPIGLGLMQFITAGMAEDNPLRDRLIDSAAHMRLLTMGVFLLLMLRFNPRGLIPEK
jgi:branched-chain amino acid transport system permease protein